MTSCGVVAALFLAAAASGRQEGAKRAAEVASGTPFPLPCPAGGRVVPPGAALQAVVDQVVAGTVLCLSDGTYVGPVEIHRSLTLQGSHAAVIHSDGTGTTLRVVADSVALEGFTVEGSGDRYDKMDAAVYVHGRGIEVHDLEIRGALFGIIAEQSHDLLIEGNHVVGRAELPVGIRGDGVRLWEVRGSVVAGNRLEDSRDILVWYSPGNHIVGNRVERSRYATHFMYSDDCVVENGDYRDNIVGVFVMYSRGTTLRNNDIAGNASAGGMGLGVKESGNLVVEANRFVRDKTCVYLDTSPFREGDSVWVRANTFARCVTGVTFHSSERRNAFLGNAFEANQTQVVVEGRGNAQGVTWKGNYFDDYQGYDLDGDGSGDVPYEVRSFSESLVADHPQLALLRGTLALGLLDAAARVFPLLEPETLLTDPQPRVSPPPARDRKEP
ncbi:MAG: nitrous oxide reductase family maturation protein NosD [Gemmatimonadetes bacterium]|nr:nitrous oxide reductase family maturation protein NosD [Gemmatimonadota bacterium]